jgi:hypothetical protein
VSQTTPPQVFPGSPCCCSSDGCQLHSISRATVGRPIYQNESRLRNCTHGSMVNWRILQRMLCLVVGAVAD